MQVVGRREVDDVDPRVGENSLERVVGGSEGGGCNGVLRQPGHPHDLDAESADRVYVHHADEPGADDGGLQLVDRAGGGHAAKAAPSGRQLRT